MELLTIVSQTNDKIVVKPIEIDLDKYIIDRDSETGLITYKKIKEVYVSKLEDLNEQQLMVLQLYYVEELNVYEIGEILSVSTGRVSQIKSAAIKKLKSLIESEVNA